MNTKTVLFGLMMSLLGSSAFATAFTPKSDDQVLERLRVNVNDVAARELRDLRGQLQQNPNNLKLAVTLARKYIQRARADADPRYNGRAQAVLAPWWKRETPPEPALVLRATLKQNAHDFKGALVDLNLAAKLDPRDPQIWVTRSVVQTVLGNLTEAKRSCLPLFQTSTELVAVTCVANAASLNGQAAKAFQTLEQVVRDNPKASDSEKSWAQGTLIETAVRLQKPEVDAMFQTALRQNPEDTYLTAEYSDYLLEKNQAARALPYLQNTRADAVLLRRVLVEKALGSNTYPMYRDQMRSRIAASHARGDTVHRREEAIFALHAISKPIEALALAKANWQVQHEPLDAKILLETAIATREYAAAKPVLEWFETTKLEDARIAKLVNTVKAGLK
jgi:tetratricopeptide (TPR) repeat protein